MAATLTRRRARTSPIEKWDVAVWNDQVHLSQEPSTSRCPEPACEEPCQLGASFPASEPPQSAPPSQTSTPCFATSASAFAFGASPARIARRKPTREPPVDSPQTRLEALSALHRSVQEHDASFLARMRELEERCHLLPDSLAVVRATDLAGTCRGRKRDAASWDEDGDVEMRCWNERRRRRSSPRADSPPRALSPPRAHSPLADKYAHSSDDEYVVTNHDHSDEEDDELDIVIVPSLASTSPSLSASLSSLPCSDVPTHNYTHIASTKSVDELAAAMAGGAGSVVEWSTDADDSHYINADITQAGALWA